MDAYIPFVLVPFVGWGMRRYLISRDGYSDLKRVTLKIAIAAYLVTELGRSFYRPYIYANGIDDGVIADTLGNSVGTVTAVFMIITMAGRGMTWDWRLFAMVILGLVAYELSNLIGHAGFDVNDLLATLIFGAISAAAYARILAVSGADRSAR